MYNLQQGHVLQGELSLCSLLCGQLNVEHPKMKKKIVCKKIFFLVSTFKIFRGSNPLEPLRNFVFFFSFSNSRLCARHVAG